MLGSMTHKEYARLLIFFLGGPLVVVTLKVFPSVVTTSYESEY